MAEKRAAFILRRRRSLGFSKCRWLRTSFSVPSRSIFFFNRRNALSTDSPFLSLISVNWYSLPLRAIGKSQRSSLVFFRNAARESSRKRSCVNGQNRRNGSEKLTSDLFPIGKLGDRGIRSLRLCHLRM